ncbi:hypothetical protein BT96DRAFT_343628 [Gymnopus androsaceus JB14]|uniref:Uncharacterized protein n=1 Tax=Gymnopus androsaceus JB14 TaxID=1447944 RepID=A0A6A4GZB0_9AGAR|nr:hypothetical protein BT96DRAFT_343628 [Gymnopus androsaceus JB14]
MGWRLSISEAVYVIKRLVQLIKSEELSVSEALNEYDALSYRFSPSGHEVNPGLGFPGSDQDLGTLAQKQLGISSADEVTETEEEEEVIEPLGADSEDDDCRSVTIITKIV